MDNTNNILVIYAVCFVLYFLPWVIASVRGHRNRTAIGLTNLLLGWTAIGWIVAFIWAFTNEK
jgi:uncharacterized membrane protein YGL010W